MTSFSHTKTHKLIQRERADGRRACLKDDVLMCGVVSLRDSDISNDETRLYLCLSFLLFCFLFFLFFTASHGIEISATTKQGVIDAIEKQRFRDEPQVPSSEEDIYIYIYVYIYVCMYMCVYVYIHIYIYVHILCSSKCLDVVCE